MFDAFEELYQQAILERSARPRHAGRLEKFDATARGDNPMCGDRIQVFIRRDAHGQLAEAAFEARGCKLSVASADLMAEAVIGADAAGVQTLFADFRTLVTTGACPECGAEERLEGLRPLSGVHLFPSRVKCTTLPWTALIAALDGRKEASSE